MHSAGQGGLKRTCTWLFNTRGGVEDTRLEAKAKDTKKPQVKDTKKPKAKDSPSEDRHSRGQGQECSRPRPRTKDTNASVLKKKVFKNFFQAISKTKVFKNFFQAISTKNGLGKNFFSRSTKF